MRALTFLLAALLVAGCASLPGERAGPTPGAAPRAIVVSSHPLAAEAGAQILRAGGNAVDAAAAVAFALTVVEPHFSGIGGGGFILVRHANGSVFVLDGRETAPAASTPDQFLLPGGLAQPFERAHTRGYAVGVPGMVRAWDDALARAGTRTLREVVEPAARLAEDGFAVDAYLERYLNDPATRQKLLSWPASARQFYQDAVCPPATPLDAEVGCFGGSPYAEGDTLVQADLARTLRLIGERGADAFYEGEIADAIVASVAAREGRMTRDDLARYAVVERAPLSFAYRDHEILTMPPPGGGVVVLQMLGILEPMGLAESGHHAGPTLHRVVEAMRLAYADRAAYLGDPAFVDVPVEGLLDPAYLAERRALIGEQANPAIGPGTPPGAARGARADPDARHTSHTSHLLVVDKGGNVVSSTMTIEQIFGAGMVVPGYGFVLNNELTDFSFTPGGANEVQPGKRPRSAMSPSIAIRDGAPALVVGASGGPTIIASVFQVIQNVLEHELPLDEAVAKGRVYSPSYETKPWNVRWDRDVPQEARDELRARGHAPEIVPSGHLSQVEAALLTSEGWVGAADTRAAPGGVVVVE